jgi:TonB family protein
VLGVNGGLFEGFLGRFEGAGRVFHRLHGMLVAGLMIFLAVMRRRGTMGVRGEFVHLCCSDVRISGHESSRNAGTTLTIRVCHVNAERRGGQRLVLLGKLYFTLAHEKDDHGADCAPSPGTQVAWEKKMIEAMTEVWKQWEGQTADGRFHLRQYLGGSESGPVFLTEFGEQESQKAAIKLVPADPLHADAQLSRWVLAENFAHPHLLRVFQSGRCEVGGVRLLYVVSELADEDLSQIIPQRALRPAEAGEMLRPVLEALAYLHGKGLVHGHIKPSNILAVGEQVKISSDGIRAARETNSRGGKPSVYDAPEAGTRGGSAAGDVWSLGVALVEVMTQKLPTWEWKGQEEPDLPKALPAPFGDIVRQCLRRDPQRRCKLAEIATRLDPDAPPLGKVKVAEVPVERRVIAQPAARAPKPQEAAKPEIMAKRIVAAKTPSSSPKRNYAIPAIAAGVVALIAIFAAPKLFNRSSPQASPEPAASTPEQPVRKTAAKTSAATKLAAKRPDSAGAAAVTPAPQPKPVANRTASGTVRGEVAHQVLPEVPESALNTISGRVRVGVRVHVDASGKVVNADLDSAGPSKYFANLAVKAAQQWKFTPAKVDGQDAPSEWILRFEFAQDGTKVTPVAR